MEIYRLVFETVFETNIVGFAGVFALGIAGGLGIAALMYKMTRKKETQDERVGRLRAKRSWDA